MKRTAIVTLCLASLALVPARANAQGASKQAAAQALFDEAKKLMGKNDFAAACQKFADSQNLDPAPGTQFNLANCYEKAGQTASAWATFKSAAASYRAHNRSDWEAKARDRANALEPKLAKLTIVVPAESATTGLDVKRDGIAVSTSELGTAIPVDPGEHVIEASAPGKKPWKTSTKVPAGAGETKVSVGPLENEPVAATPATKPGTAPTSTTPAAATTTTVEAEPPKAGGATQKTLGFVALGVGVVGLGVGTITGVMAMSKNKSSTDACPNDGACASPDAVDASKSAKDLATISTIGFIAGGVCAAAGAVLVLTAPSGSPKTGSVRIVPTAGAGSAGLLALGVF